MKKSRSKLLKILGIASIPIALFFGTRIATLEMNKYCRNNSLKIENKLHLNYLIENEKKIQDIRGKTINAYYPSEPNLINSSFPDSIKKDTYLIMLDSVLQSNSSGAIIHEMKHIAEGDCDKKYSQFIKNNIQEPRTAFYTFKRVWKSNH